MHKMHNTTTTGEKKFAGVLYKCLRDVLIKTNNKYIYAIDSLLFLTTITEKYVRIYERFIVELKSYSKAIRILSKGYLLITLIPPSKLEAILEQVKLVFTKTNKDYNLVLNRLYLYYDMKLVTFGIDKLRNLIIQFPVFVQPYMQKRLMLYQIETVPMPVLDRNKQAHTYTQLKVDKPYIALNDETYISLLAQELNTCKRIGYEFFCEELFVVKSKHKYSCASAIYFNLNPDDIRKNCEFTFYFNKTDVKPSVLDGGYKLFLQTGLNIKE